MKSKSRFILVSILLVAVLAACGTAGEAPAVVEEPEVQAATGQLQIAGSTTVQPLAEVLAEAFMDMNP
ncbi:MAG: hypothetical protein JXA97_02930, partial [Anaerolineales bacterium]|nr:hypothetical protein [Anaerolineales bacterium]